MDLIAINLAPFFATIPILFCMARSSLPRALPMWVTTASMGLVFVALTGYLPLLSNEGGIEVIFHWVPSIGLNLVLYLDGLSLLFALIISGVGAVITFYSYYYFDDTQELHRFYLLLMLFAGAMMGVVLAGNLITLFISWELTSITSFLLIGFKGNKEKEARQGALQAFLVTGAGAIALIVGLVMLGVAANQINNPDGGFGFTGNMREIIETQGLAQHHWYVAITILIAIGAFTKSAQFPFHFWLPGAKSAPTPASSYLHSATMVKAGVYLLARLYPALSGHELWTILLAGGGLLTMLIGAIFALTHRDLKGMLAYSTVSMLGALIALIGLPDAKGLKAAFVGILAHALYKAAMFLVAGTIDHATHTRIIDKLGGLWRKLPILAVIATISGLSMAGIPFFFGFVAKETLLDAMATGVGRTLYLITLIGSALTVTAALIFIWDVFFRKPEHETHVTKSSFWIDVGPGVLAFGSLTFGFLLDPVVIPLIASAVPKEFELHLFPGINAIFLTSLGVVFTGGVIFGLRNFWLRVVPQSYDLTYGERLFQSLIERIEELADRTLRLQNGRLRYYLLYIVGTLALIFIFSGLFADFDRVQLPPVDFNFDGRDLAQFVLIVLAIGAAVASIVFRNHLIAAVSLGVMGYAVGGIFLTEPAPDVALVQFLIETLATVLVIIMLANINPIKRADVMARLWQGNRRSIFKLNGVVRDAIIASVIGFSVGVFALIAVLNRPERQTIADWYLVNTLAETDTTDIVGAIVADFRATDTLIEITVFAVAAIGLRTLFRYAIQKGEITVTEDDSERKVNIHISNEFTTPFIHFVALLVFPFALLIAAEHLLFGGVGAGDGFTAGVVSGLAVTLWYVVFSYHDIQKRLAWLKPSAFIRGGLLIAFFTAFAPILFRGAFFEHVSIDKILGIADWLGLTGIHLTSALVFELAITLTVFGSVGVIIESAAHLRRNGGEVNEIEEVS